jgi:hypothetical protein
MLQQNTTIENVIENVIKKQCLQCGKEYVPHDIQGQEQKFCAKNCRAKYHNIKRAELFKEAINNSNETTTRSNSDDISKQQRNNGSTSGERHIGFISPEYLSILQEANNAKIDNLQCQLRHEDIERRYNELKKAYDDLKYKYDILDNQDDEEEEEEPTIFGQIMGIPEVQQSIPDLIKAITYQLSK